MKQIHVFFCIFVLILISCNTNDKSNPGEETNNIEAIPPPQVEVTLAKVGVFKDEIISNGKLEAHEKAELIFKVNSMVKDLRVRNGQHVQQGDTIAILENYESKNRLLQSRVSFENARIRLMDELISLGYELADSASIPPSMFQAAKIKSGYLQAHNELELASHTYNESFIIAPISGFIGNLSARENTYPKNNNLICTIMDMNAFEIIFPVMESELDEIQTGQLITVVPVYNQSLEIRGKVMEINPVVDVNGLVEARALINRPSSRLFEGMNMKVFLQVEKDNSLIVPKEAITLRTEKEVVFTFEKGLAKWNYVKTGLENSRFVTVTEGLKEGDSVIVSGNVHLAHDAEVILNN